MIFLSRFRPSEKRHPSTPSLPSLEEEGRWKRLLRLRTPCLHHGLERQREERYARTGEKSRSQFFQDVHGLRFLPGRQAAVFLFRMVQEIGRVGAASRGKWAHHREEHGKIVG